MRLVLDMLDQDRGVTETPSPSPDLPIDQKDRLWAHAIHLDGELIQRGNLYLVGESMLVTAYAVVLATATSTLAGSQSQATLLWTSRAVAGSGVALAVLWLYVNHHQWRYLLHLKQRCLKELVEYRKTWDGASHPRPAPGTVIAYGVPVVVLLMWIMLLAVTFS